MRRLLPLASLVLLAGCAGSVGAQQSDGQNTSAPTFTVTAPAPAPATAPAVPNAHHGHTTRPAPTVPTRIQMTGVDAPVIPVVMSGSTLTPPNDPHSLGWWGQRAGARHGVTLLIGHTVHTGGGALDNLEDIPVASTVTVSGITYRVSENTVISKPDLAARATDLFNQTGPHRLVVVTCEDYDTATGEYASNVVLVADPISVRP